MSQLENTGRADSVSRLIDFVDSPGVRPPAETQTQASPRSFPSVTQTPATAPRVTEVINVDAEAASQGHGGTKESHRWVLQCNLYVDAEGSNASMLQGQRTVLCKYSKVVDGKVVECNKKFSLRYLHVFSHHLNTHGVTKDNYPKRNARNNQPTIRECMAKIAPMLNHAEKVTTLIAMEGLAARLLNNPLFREITNTEMNRNTFLGSLLQLKQKLFTAAVKFFPRATLALDIGTHKRRYVAFVLVARGRALFHSMTDVADVGGIYSPTLMPTAAHALLLN